MRCTEKQRLVSIAKAHVVGVAGVDYDCSTNTHNTHARGTPKSGTTRRRREFLQSASSFGYYIPAFFREDTNGSWHPLGAKYRLNVISLSNVKRFCAHLDLMQNVTVNQWSTYYGMVPNTNRIRKQMLLTSGASNNTKSRFVTLSFRSGNGIVRRRRSLVFLCHLVTTHLSPDHSCIIGQQSQMHETR